MIARFKAAFARALPQLPQKELSWRLHFIMGALSYTLAGTDALKLIAELNPRETGNDEIAAAPPRAVPARRPARRRCPICPSVDARARRALDSPRSVMR